MKSCTTTYKTLYVCVYLCIYLFICLFMFVCMMYYTTILNTVIIIKCCIPFFIDCSCFELAVSTGSKEPWRGDARCQ